MKFNESVINHKHSIFNIQPVATVAAVAKCPMLKLSSLGSYGMRGIRHLFDLTATSSVVSQRWDDVSFR